MSYQQQAWRCLEALTEGARDGLSEMQIAQFCIWQGYATSVADFREKVAYAEDPEAWL